MCWAGIKVIEAFVLVRVHHAAANPDLDFIHTIKKEIAKLKGVKKVKGVFGLYDFVVSVQAETAEELGTLVTNTILNVKGVAHTETMVVAF
jgi:DNA-binding Lrp family transcriptional regulator